MVVSTDAVNEVILVYWFIGFNGGLAADQTDSAALQPGKYPTAVVFCPAPEGVISSLQSGIFFL